MQLSCIIHKLYVFPCIMYMCKDISKRLSSVLESYETVTFKGLKIGKLIFYGTPRAGKTTLRRQIIRNIDALQSCDSPEPSTCIAEVCVSVIVERIQVAIAENSEWKWTIQTLDDIAIMLLQCLGNKLLHVPHEVCKHQRRQLITDVQHRPDQPLKKKQRSTEPSRPTHPIQPNVGINIKQLFIEAVKTGHWSEVVSALHITDEVMMIQIIDGGGQPSFQEIFPLLISGPAAITLLIFKLTDDLLQPNPVRYQPNDGSGVEQNWQDTYVVKDSIFHALAGLVSSKTDQSDETGLNPSPSSNVLLIGTHKDQLQGTEEAKQACILRHAQSLLGWMQQSEVFKLVDVHSTEDFIIGVNNFNPLDIIKLRKKIENLISQRAPQNIPAPWLVFDFVLHKYAHLKALRKIEKTEYEEIAKLCGINNDYDMDIALYFLHHVAGTLLHYRDIPELDHYVITDFQLIFDSISKIIIKLFDGSTHMHDRILFRRKGQFQASILQDCSCCLSIPELLALLQHRHIISPLGKGLFFMPCVLPMGVFVPSQVNSCSLLVMFEQGYCPVGLFCAASTRLIVTHKWEVNRSEQFRNKISFHCTLSENACTIVFTAFSAHYEVKLIDNDNPSQVKFEIYKAINEVFTTVCKDLQCTSPLYGFYCPKTCAYDGSTYPQYQHPARRTSNSSEVTQMRCFYTDTISNLTEEHKIWFQKVLT